MINMIREPVDRVVSMFYYLRSAKRWRGKPSPPQEWFRKDLASCVNSGDLECQVRDKFSSSLYTFKFRQRTLHCIARYIV